MFMAASLDPSPEPCEAPLLITRRNAVRGRSLAHVESIGYFFPIKPAAAQAEHLAALVADSRSPASRGPVEDQPQLPRWA